MTKHSTQNPKILEHINWMNVGLETFRIREWSRLMKQYAIDHHPKPKRRSKKERRREPIKWLRDTPVTNA